MKTSNEHEHKRFKRMFNRESRAESVTKRAKEQNNKMTQFMNGK